MRKPVKGVVTLAISGVANLPAGASATLRLYRGAKSASSRSIALTKRGNAYTGTLRIRQTTKAQVVFLQTRAAVGSGAPTCTPTFGVPCQTSSQAGLALRSNTVRIVIPRKR